MYYMIIVALLITLLFAPIGCFVIWKKYAYFADGLSHASMLAVVVALIANVPVVYTIIINTIIFTLIIYKLQQNIHSKNTIVGFVSSIMVSGALILSKFYPTKVDIGHVLFGHIASATLDHIKVILILIIITACFLILKYKELMLFIISQEIAKSRNINVNSLELGFLLILAASVLSTIQIVGSLFVVSLIIVPATCAQLVSNSPVKMIIYAMLIGILMNICGITLYSLFDTPFVPSVVISGAATYLLCTVIKYFRQ